MGDETEAQPELVDSVTFKLRRPVQLGKKGEPVEEFVIKVNGRLLKGISVTMTSEGGMIYVPYDLAKAGVRAAGHPDPILDLMHPADVNELAQVVVGFLA